MANEKKKSSPVWECSFHQTCLDRQHVVFSCNCSSVGPAGCGLTSYVFEQPPWTIAEACMEQPVALCIHSTLVLWTLEKGGRGSVKAEEWASLWESRTPAKLIIKKLRWKCPMIPSFNSFTAQTGIILGWNPFVSFLALCCCLGRKPKQWKQKWPKLSISLHLIPAEFPREVLLVVFLHTASSGF